MLTCVLPGVTYSYPDNEYFALKTPEIKLSGTGYTCIIGKNGSGKSTLGMALATASRKTMADPWFYLPQYMDRFLFAEHLLEQLEELLGQTVDRDRLLQELADMGFSAPADLLTFPFILMSGGERRRVALASVFYLGAKRLILDEPNIGLAPKENMVLLAKMNNLQPSMSGLIVITHHHEFVAGSSDLICMESGRVEHTGLTAELMADPEFELKTYGVR